MIVLPSLLLLLILVVVLLVEVLIEICLVSERILLLMLLGFFKDIRRLD